MSSLHQNTVFFLYKLSVATLTKFSILLVFKKVMLTIFKPSSEILINWILLGGYEILSAMYEYSQNH